jgi:hypothetical protein
MIGLFHLPNVCILPQDSLRGRAAVHSKNRAEVRLAAGKLPRDWRPNSSATRAGDFNTDGTVDAADYIVWRNGLGTTYTQADYDAWRANFGRSAAGPAAVAGSLNIPEPTGVSLLMIGLAVAYLPYALRMSTSVRRVLTGAAQHASQFDDSGTVELQLIDRGPTRRSQAL